MLGFSAMMRPPIGRFAHQDRKWGSKNKKGRTSAAYMLETHCRKTLPHIERLRAQGTVASPTRLPDLGTSQITPDVICYYPQFALWVNIKVSFANPPVSQF
jgi:hypothetical protein